MSTLQVLSTRTHNLPDSYWDAFVEAHDGGHLLQTTPWAALKADGGWRAERVALAEDGEILAGGQVLLRRLPWGQSLAYIPKGPIVDWSQPEHVRALLQGVLLALRSHRPALLKVEPDRPDSPLMDMLLTSYGFQRGDTVQPRSTIHIELGEGLDNVLAGMKQKWRYNVRLAGRKGVAVRAGTAADLDRCVDLMVETGRRDGFTVHEAAYYRQAFDLFARREWACWFVAEFEGQILGVVVVFVLGGKSWYLWGASSNQERNRMPNYALQWAAMQWAAARGCRTYDFWGIPDDVGADPEAWTEGYADQEGGLWGVYRFKQGFGGHVVRYTGAWDLSISRSGYALYQLAQRMRG